MEAIKKKIAALKMEMDAANEKVETNETKAKLENLRADKLNDDVRDLQKKLAQLERDYEVAKANLEQSTSDLEQCEKSWSRVCKRLQLISSSNYRTATKFLAFEEPTRSTNYCNSRFTLLGGARPYCPDEKSTRN